MNYEQIIFQKVIKARRNRLWRLANPNRNKTIVKSYQPIVEKVGWFNRFMNWIKSILK